MDSRTAAKIPCMWTVLIHTVTGPRCWRYLDGETAALMSVKIISLASTYPFVSVTYGTSI
jgi:hypothetical protein